MMRQAPAIHVMWARVTRDPPVFIAPSSRLAASALAGIRLRWVVAALIRTIVGVAIIEERADRPLADRSGMAETASIGDTGGGVPRLVKSSLHCSRALGTRGDTTAL
jgi:hypothetical protein